MSETVNEKRDILGVAVTSATADEAVALLDRRVSEGQRTTVAFLNAHAAVLASQNPFFRRALGASVVFNDGAGLDVASRLKYGSAFTDNLNGTDFIPHYLQRTSHRFRIFLLGASEAVASDTARILAERYPQHRIVGWHDGFFRKDDNDRTVEAIRASGANLLLVAMGNPLQELWIAENQEKTGAVLAFGVGALFDFIAGRFPRAPRLVRLSRAEWLFRLLCEPKRLWRRYTLGNAMFLALALRDAVRSRLESR